MVFVPGYTGADVLPHRAPREPAPGRFVARKCTVNKKDLKRFYDLLTAERTNLVKKANKTLTEEATLDVSELPDEIDQASAEYNQSFTFRLRDREKFYLSKIDRALKKIDEGDFGVCESCGEDISVKRLEARPVTTLCIRCKEEQEMEERSYA